MTNPINFEKKKRKRKKTTNKQTCIGRKSKSRMNIYKYTTERLHTLYS